MSVEKQVLHGFSGKWDVEDVIGKMEGKTPESYYLCNLSDVVKKFDDWVEKIPRVKPFYAVSSRSTQTCNLNKTKLTKLASFIKLKIII